MSIFSVAAPLIAIVTVAVLVLIPDNAFAYLDPGTGSMILQLLIAGALGALFTVKNIFGRIKSFIGLTLRKFRKKDDES